MVTMQVCHAHGCEETDGLVFEEDIGEHYCPHCLEKVNRVEETGDYDICLTTDEMAQVALVFKAFDKKRTGVWSYAQFNEYCGATAASRASVPEFTSDKDFHEYVLEEYGVACQTMHPAPFDPAMMLPSFGLAELRKVYGGYAYNGMDALREDVETLEEEGVVHTSVLE